MRAASTSFDGNEPATIDGRGRGAEGPDGRSPTPPPSAGKLGMWVFLATDAMGFAGLLFAQAVLRVRETAWPDPAVRFDRTLAAALTFVLLASGATMASALGAVRARRPVAARRLIVVTAALGALFVAGQLSEFRALAIDRHVGLVTDQAAGLFFVIAGFHGLHVLAGVGILAALAIRGWAADDSASGHGAAPRRGALLEVASLYWQFVDVVWVVIFTVIYLVPPVRVG